MKVEILVASNSATDSMLIKDMLSEHNVLIANDDLEARSILESNEGINLLVINLENKETHELKILEFLENDEKLNKIQKIIISSNKDCAKIDGYDYVNKPIDIDIFKTRLELHIELIRARHILQQEAYEKDVIFDAVFNQIPLGISISYNADAIEGEPNQYFRCNPAYEKITGRKKQELTKLGWVGITHPDDIEENIIAINMLKSGNLDNYAFDKRYIKPDGSIVWVNLLGAKLDMSDNNPYNHIALIQDISEKKMMETALMESERSKSVLLSHLPGMAYRCKFDKDWTMEYISEGCLDLTGYTTDTLLDNRKMSFNDLMAPEYREILWQEWERILPQGLKLKYEYEIITASGERKWVLELGQGIYDDKGNVEALEGIIIDISDRKAMENILKYNSEHDNRTGLYNRTYLENLLNSDRYKGNQGKRALVGINLNTIHSLTSTYGFHYTLETICNIAEALKKIAGEGQSLYMTYENRFVFYVRNYTEKNELVVFTNEVIKALETVLATERIGGSIGIVEIEDKKQLEANLLFKNLMIASENAITSSDSEYGVCFYDKLLEEKVEKAQVIKKELTEIATSSDDGGLFLQYQPILDLKNNKIYGFEALARLNSKKYGLVPPLEFIPLAEKNKLIVDIGNKVLRQALGFLKRLNKNGYHELSVSINVSVIQFMKKDFISNLFETIDKIGVDSKNIGIEITESLVAINFNAINSILGELREAGISVYIDDFGTGYSSLARENELNVNFLKIDKSFIDSLLFIKLEESITGDIVSLAHRLGHRVVAEGVEDIRQMGYLKECGCDMVQGYYISRPLDENIAFKFLKEKPKEVLI
jgi:PAS domain S-box-containing protein